MALPWVRAPRRVRADMPSAALLARGSLAAVRGLHAFPERPGALLTAVGSPVSHQWLLLAGRFALGDELRAGGTRSCAAVPGSTWGFSPRTRSSVSWGAQPVPKQRLGAPDSIDRSLCSEGARAPARGLRAELGTLLVFPHLLFSVPSIKRRRRVIVGKGHGLILVNQNNLQ